MKRVFKKLLILIPALSILNGTLFVDNCFSQSGWVLQGTMTSNHLSGVYFINQQTGYIAGFWGTIIKTTNSGLNWSFQNSGEPNQGFLSTTFINEQTGWCYGGSWTTGATCMVKTTNGGQNWSTVINSNIGCFSWMFFVNQITGYLTTSKGYILKTTNAGTNWNTIFTNLSLVLNKSYFIDQNTGWVVGDNGTIMKTTDGGNNWILQTSNTSAALTGIYFTTANTGIITGDFGIILKTTNAGQNWVSKPGGTSLWLLSPYFINNNTGWIVGGNVNNTVSVILRTDNGGENWVTQNSPANTRLNCVCFTNATNGYIAGSNGVVLMTSSGGLLIPNTPTLLSPPNNAVDVSNTPTLQWNQSSSATNYKVQISPVANFYVITDSATVTTNQYIIPPGKLSGGYTYFWRVNASNSVGTSAWSTVWSFSTSIYPPAPILISPANGFIGTSTTPTLRWNNIPGMVSYSVQISTVPNFIVITDSSIVDTNQYIVPPGKLSLNITYFWRVSAKNIFGTGSWSSVWSFTPQPVGINIISSDIPKDFKLNNNYPNPFNPTTNIKYSVPISGLVKLILFDALGREVETLVNSQHLPGTYCVTFDGSKLTSGIYFYKMEAESFLETKKLVLLK